MIRNIIPERCPKGNMSGEAPSLPRGGLCLLGYQRHRPPAQRRRHRLPVIADIPLEPFSEPEARQFLASKGIADEPVIQVIRIPRA